MKATIASERACKRPELPSQVETTVPLAELPTVVFVIGESSTRNHWHLYGYPHRTTDCLDAIKDELVIFKDVNTVDVGTYKSLRFLLTCATTERPDDFRYTFSSVVSRAGYRSAFYTMTQRWGAGMGGISVLFDGCDESVHLKELLKGDFKGYDEQLLPFLKKGLGKYNLICLHTLGSHYPYGGHVPSTFGTGGKTPIEAYDRSIRYTDWFLNEVINELRKLSSPSIMIYISDHGETPESRTWRDLSCKNCWEIPMFIWFSQSYRNKFPELVSQITDASVCPLGTDELLQGLLSVCCIKKLKGITDADIFFSRNFTSRRQRCGIETE